MSATDAIPTPAWPQSLLDLLTRQQTMVNDLVRLADSQATLIAEGRADQLLHVLARRQSIIDDFTASQADLSILTQSLDQRIESLAADERHRIRSMINEISERLTQVMKRDEADQVALRGRRDHVKHELNSLGVARKAQSAYQPSSPGTTRYADQHG